MLPICKCKPETNKGWIMTNLMNDLMKFDEEIEGFLQKHINSFVKWEIIRFFHANPQTNLTLNELSKIFNRPLKQLKPDIRELSEGGLIKQQKQGGTTFFSFNLSDADPQEKKMKKIIDDFIALCQTRQGRLRVIYKMLKDGIPLTDSD